MMRPLLVLGSLLLFTVRGYAQDIILQTNGEELPGKVLTVGPEQITYLSTTAGRSDTLQLAASSVFLIRYANGTKEVLHPPTAEPAKPAAPEPLSKEDAYARGRLDARRYYKAPGVFWGTYAATVVTGGYGGPVVGIVTGVTAPKARNFIVPETQLLQDPNYVAGYKRQAHNRKIGSAAGGFGAGVGTLAVVTVVLVAILLNSGW